MKKLRMAGALALIALLASPVFAGGKKDAAPSGGATGGLKVAILTTSGVDDGSFGQDCWNGILEFKKNNPEAEITSIKEPDMAKVVTAVGDVIADYDVLVLPGFQFSPVGAVLQDNPNRKVILVDTAPVDAEGNTIELSNIYSMQFHEEESGFFAGIAAALETKTGKVAVVGGMAFPSVVNYHLGFNSGVSYANKHYGARAQIVELPSYAGTDVTGKAIGGNYVGGFADEATGKVIGQALINQGADVLFAAAGASGNGVFTAAKEASNVYIIGVDVDQYDDGFKGNENIMLTSAVKVMNINVTRQLQAIKDGSFNGRNVVLGADTDSTGYISAEGRSKLSANTREKLREAYALLRSGTIVPAANFNGHTAANFPGL
ncbi:MAG: BMP family ABC transporter substrate-binding protein [Treponema sp.]|jgi:basic membrane protein A|nr:BMP family ABC transporter substrate-binding protein [Treponema sp.]